MRDRLGMMAIASLVAIASSGAAQAGKLPRLPRMESDRRIILRTPLLARSDLVRRLTGDSFRDWIKMREAPSAGTSHCEAGERWRFLTGGTLRVRKCLGGGWRITQHTWRLAPDGSVDQKIEVVPSIRENGRRVLFRNNGTILVLRRMPNRKTQTIENTELSLATGTPPKY